MKPDITRFLEVAAGHLIMRTAPAAADAYEQSNLTILAAMLMAVREEFDRSAARRIEENRILRRLFIDAAPAVTDGRLRERVEEAGRGEESGFAISDLERANAALRGLLIELHAHVEVLDTPEARRVEAAIWQELAASTQRRVLSMGPF